QLLKFIDDTPAADACRTDLDDALRADGHAGGFEVDDDESARRQWLRQYVVHFDHPAPSIRAPYEARVRRQHCLNEARPELRVGSRLREDQIEQLARRRPGGPFEQVLEELLPHAVWATAGDAEKRGHPHGRAKSHKRRGGDFALYSLSN